MSRMFFIAGESGAGKTTLVREALRRYPDKLRYLVTLTTRPPRPGLDEPEYEFVSQAGYQARKSEALHWDEGEYYGHHYGCDPDDANRTLKSGTSIIVGTTPVARDIETMRMQYAGESLVVYVRTSKETRLQRLLARGVVEELG